jgi:hypothetical protein
MKTAKLVAVLLLVSCKSPQPALKPEDTQKNKPQTLAVIDKLKPVSAPVSEAVSTPTTMLASTLPTSLTSTTQATSMGAALVSLPTTQENKEIATSFLLEVTEDEYKGRTSFTVSHPDPAVQKRINVMVRSKTTKEGCKPALMSTAIVSFSCLSPEGYIDPDTSRTAGGSYSSASVYNFVLVEGALVPITADDVFLDRKKAGDLAFFKDEFRNNSLVMQVELEEDKFIIFSDGISFFSAYATGIPSEAQVRFAEHPELFKLNQWPLSSTKNIQDLPGVDNIKGFQQNIEMLPFDPKSPPASMPVYGTIIDGTHWKDSAGENYLLVTERSAKSKKDETLTSKYVNAYHFKKLDEVITNVRTVFEKEENCALENQAKFIKDSIVVADLDLDGVGEVSFASRLGCANAGDPVPFTVYLLEAGGKYALRGLSKSTEEQKPDGPFANASANFLLFLQERWQELADKQ